MQLAHYWMNRLDNIVCGSEVVAEIYSDPNVINAPVCFFFDDHTVIPPCVSMMNPIFDLLSLI